MREWQRFVVITVAFAAAYLIPFDHPKVQQAVIEAFALLHQYAREHVLFCLVPAFFIAGAISNFVSQQAVLRYFGPGAKRWLAYAVASVSGTVLAVCSCTVLPLFAGIYKRGAGLGPAVAFLYSGPAINVLAIVLTARVLGWQLAVARAIGATVFSVVIGLLMAWLYRRQESQRTAGGFPTPEELPPGRRTAVQNLTYFATLVLVLVFAAWTRPAGSEGAWLAVYRAKWCLVGVLLAFLGYQTWRWFDREERRSWLGASWGFAQQILPLLFAGVLVSGALMGRPGSDHGLIPGRYVQALVGANSLQANLAASVLGAFMYFATLTEVPILHGLIAAGMGRGPALALLLAGPALSLPNMLVIRTVLGTGKTLTYVALVVLMATVTGLCFGWLMM